MSTLQNKRTLTMWGFFSITAAMVLTVYEYPTFATSKLHLVFFLILGGLFWFIPVALCAAEMATVKGWNDNGGGEFSWVSHTLGTRFGFAAIFFQWFQITVNFCTMIYFILGALSFVVSWPALTNNAWVKFWGVLIVFWLVTFSQFGGTKYTQRIAKFGFLIGILIPSAILFILAIWYLCSGGKLLITFTPHQFIPDFSKVDTLVVFVSFILAYMGGEASASYINELKNPNKNYPLVMFILVILAICLDTLGGLTVAAVIPQNQLSLSAGVVQAFNYLFINLSHGELGWLTRIIGLMLACGVIAEISSWVTGPSRAIYDTAKIGIIPSYFKKTNEHNIPVRLIIVQGIIVSIWDAVLTLGGGGGNVSFFAAMGLTVVIYLVAYFLFFISYLVLVYKKKDLPRTYNVPGGTFGKTIIAVCGFLVTLFAFIISFFPTTSLPASSHGTYMAILIISFLVVLTIPFIIFQLTKKHHTGLLDENAKEIHK